MCICIIHIHIYYVNKTFILDVIINRHINVQVAEEQLVCWMWKCWSASGSSGSAGKLPLIPESTEPVTGDHMGSGSPGVGGVCTGKGAGLSDP